MVDGSGKDGRISSFDYRAWDKFDVVGFGGMTLPVHTCIHACVVWVVLTYM